MNWRWLIYDHIPTELNIPKEQRRAILWEVTQGMAVLKMPGGVFYFTLLISIILLLLIGFNLGLEFFFANNVFSPFVLLYTTSFGLIGQFLCAIVWRSLYQRRTYRILCEHGYDICSNCGYLLKGLPEDQDNCPECGAEVTRS